MSLILIFFLRTGYWSSGNRLIDSRRVPGEGIEFGDLPEYIVSFITSLIKYLTSTTFLLFYFYCSVGVRKPARGPLQFDDVGTKRLALLRILVDKQPNGVRLEVG